MKMIVYAAVTVGALSFCGAASGQTKCEKPAYAVDLAGMTAVAKASAQIETIRSLKQFFPDLAQAANGANIELGLEYRKSAAAGWINQAFAQTLKDLGCHAIKGRKDKEGEINEAVETLIMIFDDYADPEVWRSGQEYYQLRKTLRAEIMALQNNRPVVIELSSYRGAVPAFNFDVKSGWNVWTKANFAGLNVDSCINWLNDSIRVMPDAGVRGLATTRDILGDYLAGKERSARLAIWTMIAGVHNQISGGNPQRVSINADFSRCVDQVEDRISVELDKALPANNAPTTSTPTPG